MNTVTINHPTNGLCTTTYVAAVTLGEEIVGILGYSARNTRLELLQQLWSSQEARNLLIAGGAESVDWDSKTKTFTAGKYRVQWVGTRREFHGRTLPRF